MSVEWDSRKAAANLRKHGIDFADAVTALDDERAVTVPEVLSGDEPRHVTLGDGCASAPTRGHLHVARRQDQADLGPGRQRLVNAGSTETAYDT